jgi:hypothetical protein
MHAGAEHLATPATRREETAEPRESGVEVADDERDLEEPPADE